MKKLSPHTIFLYRVEGFMLASLFYTFFLVLWPNLVGLKATLGPPSVDYCGDAMCSSSEDSSTCPMDCGSDEYDGGSDDFGSFSTSSDETVEADTTDDDSESDSTSSDSMDICDTDSSMYDQFTCDCDNNGACSDSACSEYDEVDCGCMNIGMCGDPGCPGYTEEDCS